MVVDAGGAGSLGERPGALKGDHPMRPLRPREMQDPLNFYLYHPLAWQLARRLAGTPLTPNMVSVIGGLFVVAAALSYWALPWPVGAALGMVLHMTWHVVDGADGDLARITGRSTPLGEMVDGICDYASHIVLYIILAFILQRSIGGMAWAWTVAAGLSHIVQSNHVEVQRRFYQYWIHGVPFLHHSSRTGSGLFGQSGGAARLLRPIAALYLRLAAGMTPRLERIDAAVTGANDDSTKLAEVRGVIRSINGPLLLLLKILGPNLRAIVLGLSMLAQTPLYYFVYQAIVLNLLLVLSVVLHNRAAMRVEAALGLSSDQ